MFKLKTERLYLRCMLESDAKSAFLLNSDPLVIKYTGDEPFASEAEAAEFLRNYQSYKLYGYGRWAVIRKEDDAFLGWCGLKFDPQKNEIDLGYRFFQKYWNKGYATEASIACLKWGFEEKQLPYIVANIQKENLGSIAVAKKLGMYLWKEEGECGGEPSYSFRLDRDSFLSS